MKNDRLYIILFGIKHCGKSSAGKALAEKLDASFYDTDDIICEMTGKTARQIYTESGEAAFKAAETEACAWLRRMLKPEVSPAAVSDVCVPAVIATGGGICSNDEALAQLNGVGTGVFIDAGEDTVAGRIIRKSKESGSWPAYIARENPQNDDDVRRIFHRFYTERRQRYQKLAPVTVLPGATPEETARKILAVTGIHGNSRHR